MKQNKKEEYFVYSISLTAKGRGYLIAYYIKQKMLEVWGIWVQILAKS